MDIGGWLRSLGLEQYETVFRESKVDASILSELDGGTPQASWGVAAVVTASRYEGKPFGALHADKASAQPSAATTKAAQPSVFHRRP